MFRAAPRTLLMVVVAVLIVAALFVLSSQRTARVADMSGSFAFPLLRVTPEGAPAGFAIAPVGN